MKYSSKGNLNRQYYVSREVGQMLGNEAEYIPSPYVIALYPKGATAATVLRGLALICAELEGEIEVEAQRSGAEDEKTETK